MKYYEDRWSTPPKYHPEEELPEKASPIIQKGQPFMDVQIWIGGNLIVDEAMRVGVEEVEPGIFKGRTNPEAVLKFMEETTYALLQRLGEMVTENKETEAP
jgi:hypothetical protein